MAAPATPPSWKTKAKKKTLSIYFTKLADLRRVKDAAALAGMPYTAFIRAAAVQKANDVIERAS